MWPPHHGEDLERTIAPPQVGGGVHCVPYRWVFQAEGESKVQEHLACDARKAPMYLGAQRATNASGPGYVAIRRTAAPFGRYWANASFTR